MTRTRARQTLHTFGVTHNNFDNFCLYAGFGIRVGYPSAKLLGSLPRSQRGDASGRIVLALTANPYYGLDGVKPGATLTLAARRLHVGKAIRVGRNDWYLVPGTHNDRILKVQKGIVLEVGLADRALLTTAGARRRFLNSFDDLAA